MNKCSYDGLKLVRHLKYWENETETTTLMIAESGSESESESCSIHFLLYDCYYKYCANYALRKYAYTKAAKQPSFI